MASQTFALAEEETTAFLEAIEDVKAEFSNSPSAGLCEAVHSGNKQNIQDWLSRCGGVLTADAKKEAILLGKHDILELLLEGDNFIDEDTMATACAHKAYDAIRILLAHGWPINRQLHLTASLLSTAVNETTFMRWLVQIGADVNARSGLDESVLSIAIAHGSLSVVQFLLESGADVARGDLLHCAAQRANQEEAAALVDLLVQRGADVNAHKYANPVAGQWRALYRLPTPLHFACEHDNVQVARALLRHGADPQCKMLEAGKLASPTPLDKAITMHLHELVQLFNTSISC